MTKNSKILIIGFGSIGQRHYWNLRGLGYRNVWVYDADELKVKNLELRINDLKKNTLKQFVVVFVCSPNNWHIKHALAAARAGCHLFIEKPLSHSSAGLKELASLCRQHKLVNMVGCDMRFDPGLIFIKKYISAGKLGKVYAIHHEYGYYLPYWRPQQDYRKNYAAKKKSGGGIILDDLHEFDLLFWLNDFRAAKEAKFIFGRVSELKIETEDICAASFKFTNRVIGTVRCDYLQQAEARSCKVIGRKGTLEWQVNENAVWLKTAQGKRTLMVTEKFNSNQPYIDEIKYFFSCVKSGRRTFNDIAIASKVLSYCIKGKEKSGR
jgi:predicted dehydrogenase